MCFWGSGTLAIYLYGFICILYAAPPYSACISAICLLPSGKNWLGSVCSVQCLATKHNAKFTEDWWNLRSNFNPFVGQSSRNFQTMYKTLRPFQRFCLITFCLVFAVTSRNRRKTEVLFAPHFWERRPTFLGEIVVAIYCPPFGKVWSSSVCRSPSAKPGNEKSLFTKQTWYNSKY